MKLLPKISHSQLRVLSSFCTDLAAAWFVALFISQNLWLLTRNFVFCILWLGLAFKLEKMSEDKKYV